MKKDNKTRDYGSICIVPVLTTHQRKVFTHFPYKLYRNHDYWIAPLKNVEKKQFSIKTNSFLRQNPHCLFLAYRYGKVVGRISAHLNHDHQRIYNENAGFIGFFESINNQRVANALFNAALDWLKAQEIKIIRGPVSFTMNEMAGLLTEGFKINPAVNMPYHPTYYSKLWDSYGFTKEKELFAWYFNPEACLHPIVNKIADTAERTPGLIVRKFNKKDCEGEFQKTWEIYKNAWQKEWGNYPPDWEEFYPKALLLKKIVNNNFVWIAEIHNQPVGIGLALPDINQVLSTMNGRLWPWNLFKLWRFVKYPQSLRILVLELDREFQDSGIDAILYRKIFLEAKKQKIQRAEISWTREENKKMNKLFAKSGGKICKKYSIYRMFVI